MLLCLFAALFAVTNFGVWLQFEDAWSKGEIPSNTEDILRSRGVYSVGDPRLGNQTDDSQAYAQGKVMRG